MIDTEDKFNVCQCLRDSLRCPHTKSSPAVMSFGYNPALEKIQYLLELETIVKKSDSNDFVALLKTCLQDRLQ